jgi:hypothetical protein
MKRKRNKTENETLRKWEHIYQQTEMPIYIFNWSRKIKKKSLTLTKKVE